tara:strand:- start:21 stop:233 length:213 start_codon:yes stop_codon:yes gene_type:complete
MAYIKVEGNTDLVRDTNTGAIININTTQMREARVMKFNRKKKDDEIIALKNDVAEMKQLLKKLVEDKNGG